MIIRTMIIASEGHFVTDGNTYGKVVIPAENVDTTAFHEITEEEYYNLSPEERPDEVTDEENEIAEE